MPLGAVDLNLPKAEAAARAAVKGKAKAENRAAGERPKRVRAQIAEETDRKEKRPKPAEVVKSRSDAGKSSKIIAEAKKLARRATNFGDPLTGLCRDVPGTAPGTKITEVSFTGAPGKRLEDIKGDIQPLLAKGFGTTLSNKKTFDRVGDKKNTNRYVDTPGCAKFGCGGPMFAYIETFLEETFCPALREAFPDAIRGVEISGMHVFLNKDAKFNMHRDRMGSHPDQAMFLIHVGHPGVWVQKTSVKGGHQSRVERSHGCVVSMDKNARVLLHGFSDPKHLGATLLFEVDLKDGADTETIEKINRHLAVAINAIMLIFDAETAMPDPSELAADGGPIAMAWNCFNKHCRSDINSVRGKAGGKKGGKKTAAMCAAVKLVEESERRGVKPGPKQAAAAAKLLKPVQRIRAGRKAGGKKTAAMCAAVKLVEESERRGVKPGPKQAAAAAKLLPSVQRVRAGRKKGNATSSRRARERRKGRVCLNCQAEKTPKWWLSGPDGSQTLCNKCGYHFRKYKEHRAIKPKATDIVTGEDGGQSIRGCFNPTCQAKVPRDGCSVGWRPGPEGPTTLCNACGHYFDRNKKLPNKPTDEARNKATDEADAKIRKEHSEGGDLNKITGDEFKAFLTKAGEKPKGGLSKMPKPKLRELVDAVLARSQ